MYAGLKQVLHGITPIYCYQTEGGQEVESASSSLGGDHDDDFSEASSEASSLGSFQSAGFDEDLVQPGDDIDVDGTPHAID